MTSSYRMRCSRPTDHDGVTRSKAHTDWSMLARSSHINRCKSYYVKNREQEGGETKLMILICCLYEHKGILWNFVWTHTPFRFILRVYIQLFIHTPDRPIYNLWVNDDIDKGLLSLSFFLTPFSFFFFFSTMFMYHTSRQYQRRR